MKGNRKLLALALLLLFVLVSFGTYAIYKSSASGSTTVQTANWVVTVNGSDAVTTDSFTFSASDINWSGVTHGKNGKIAPGDSGTLTILIDADGSEVDVDYVVAIGTVTGTNSNSNFTVTGSDLTGTINYSATSGQMEKTVVLNVTWTAQDETAQNAADVGIAGQTVSIPVTVTASQHIASN